MTVIYRQLIMNDITLFTSQPKAKFYDELFIHLDLSSVPDRRCEKGRQGFSRHAMICAAIVMKCECFEYVTDLVDYLNNNLIMQDSRKWDRNVCGFAPWMPFKTFRPSRTSLFSLLPPLPYSLKDLLSSSHLNPLCALLKHLFYRFFAFRPGGFICLLHF